MNEPDYLHEDTHRLDEQIAQLKSSLHDAKKEALHATGLNVDLTGPIAAAKKDQAQLTAEIQDLENVIARVSAGYPHFERAGFESAVDACGQLSQWQRLSEIPVPGTVFGNDSAEVRLPIQVQEAYAKALASRLFDGFVVCTCFDVPEDNAETDVEPENFVQHLFGLLIVPSLSEKEALF